MELCLTLIERWRPETNTFHMYYSKMAITLEDVSFITGLSVDGAAVFEELKWKQYACAYALACIGSFLMAERSGATIHPAYLLLLERERPSDDQHFAWGGCGTGLALPRDGALYFQLGDSQERLRQHRRLDGAPTGLGVGAFSIHRPEDTRRQAQRPRRLRLPMFEKVQS
ncbi:Protein MAINTENANCE OF MERISTEMS [Linum grandiflorum]